MDKWCQRAIQTMRAAVEEQTGWVKVHAAELLLELGYREGIAEAFGDEHDRRGEEPAYRIGIARVLARAESGSGQQVWVQRIADAYMAPDSPDRLHAIEALAKLGEPLTDQPAVLAKVRAAAADGADAERVFAQWVLLNRGDPAAEAFLGQALESDEEGLRLNAAYALRFQRRVQAETVRRLHASAVAEPAHSAARVYLLSAAARHGDPSIRAAWKPHLLEYARSASPEAQYEALLGLAAFSDHADLAWLGTLLDDAGTDSDVRAAAAYNICRIARRQSRHLAAFDWAVIGAYAVGMLGVGWFFSRQNTSADDYLLGGRSIRSWAVGLSLFATLLSTLSYLSVPGETIRHGPMILGQILAYPMIFLVVGWVMIPYIMRLKITSAYEILEIRFGVSVRLLGALIFLSMRLVWMAVIIYATVMAVLIPLTGLPPESAMWVSAVMGAVTIVYTAWGGLKAVIWTDVIQTAILFLGAAVTLIVITTTLGGIGAWWPTGWESQWAEPRFGFDTSARMPLGWLMVTAFCWYVCTAGSDQMAVQRYLSTRDARAARRAFMVNMIADASVMVLLAVLGLALYGYFRAKPYQLPDGLTLGESADTLFPQFIVFALPVGLTGLVVAALLAAAMSSLSSGLNSSCSVILSDFMERFARKPMAARRQVYAARAISLIVGSVVVVATLAVSHITGNLLEVAFKSVNLLVAPLFVLFALAMFVPWATVPGAWGAAIASVTVAVLIAYWDAIFGTKWGVSFLWIMPLSLTSGMVVGSLLSLIPVGRGRQLERFSHESAAEQAPGSTPAEWSVQDAG